MKRELEQKIFNLTIDVLNNKENALTNLENFVNALWEIRTQLKKEIVEYSLLFHFYYYFNCDPKKRLEYIKVATPAKDILISLEKRYIKIVNFEKEKECTIKVKDKISKELVKYLKSFYFDDKNLNLTKITEEYTIEELT